MAAFSSTVLNHIASITNGFSFAYVKELYLDSKLTFAQQSTDEVAPSRRTVTASGVDSEICCCSELRSCGKTSSSRYVSRCGEQAVDLVFW